MQFIEGRTLEEELRIQPKRQTWLDLMLQLCSILTPIHRHKHKYQHRDIKPANIILQDSRKVFLIDFDMTSRRRFSGEGSHIYRAPEQSVDIQGIANDRIDIFSLGVIMYELTTLHKPINGIDYYSSNEGLLQGEWEEIIPPQHHNPLIPEELNQVILKCMKLNPSERYRDAGELRHALSKIKRKGVNIFE